LGYYFFLTIFGFTFWYDLYGQLRVLKTTPVYDGIEVFSKLVITNVDD